MASLSDLSGVFNQQAPTGFSLAQLGIQGGLMASEAGVQSDRAERDFGQRYLPDLLSNQAARGAYQTGATRVKATRAFENFGDLASDLAARGAQGQSQLATNALLAQTGISI